MLKTSLLLFTLSLTALTIGANNFVINLSVGKVLCFLGVVLSVICFITALVKSSDYDKHF